jgi:hypothetical protein
MTRADLELAVERHAWHGSPSPRATRASYMPGRS